MRNFFQKSKHLRRQHRLDVYENDFDAVNHARDVLRRAKIKSRLDVDNLEEIYTALEMVDTIDGIEGLSAKEARATQQSLNNLIKITLEQSIRFPVSRNEQRQYSILPTQSYKKLASAAADIRLRIPSFPITFLTFNYDIAFDYALYHSKARYSYCFNEKNIVNNRYIRYCKLHGSMHWALDNTTRKLVDANLNFSNMYEDNSALLEAKDVCLRVEKDLWNKEILTDTHFPMIVPPTGNKPYLHSLLKPVWKQAAIALKEAEIIIVIGYSFPQSDQFFRNFFALSTIGPTDLEKIVLIDPSDFAHKELLSMVCPDLHSKIEFYQSTFEDSLTKITKVLKNYLAEW